MYLIAVDPGCIRVGGAVRANRNAVLFPGISGGSGGQDGGSRKCHTGVRTNAGSRTGGNGNGGRQREARHGRRFAGSVGCGTPGHDEISGRDIDRRREHPGGLTIRDGVVHDRARIDDVLQLMRVPQFVYSDRFKVDLREGGVGCREIPGKACSTIIVHDIDFGDCPDGITGSRCIDTTGKPASSSAQYTGRQAGAFVKANDIDAIGKCSVHGCVCSQDPIHVGTAGPGVHGTGKGGDSRGIRGKGGGFALEGVATCGIVVLVFRVLTLAVEFHVDDRIGDRQCSCTGGDIRIVVRDPDLAGSCGRAVGK